MPSLLMLLDLFHSTNANLLFYCVIFTAKPCPTAFYRLMR